MLAGQGPRESPRTLTSRSVEKANAAGGSGRAGHMWPARASQAAITDLPCAGLGSPIFGRRKGLGSLEQCGSGSEDARASLTPSQTRRDPHLSACQVEKGKCLDLEERFDALRREHTETLQGACQDSRAPCSHPAHSPRPAGAPPAPCRVVGMLPLLLCSTVGLRWGLLAQCPRTGDAQFTSTLAELQRAHEQEKLLLAESHHRSQAALQVPMEKYLGRGCLGRA